MNVRIATLAREAGLPTGAAHGYQDAIEALVKLVAKDCLEQVNVLCQVWQTRVDKAR